MNLEWLFYLYGMCTMFNLIMALGFWRKGPERLYRLVAILLFLTALLCYKTPVFIDLPSEHHRLMLLYAWVIEVVSVPLYSFVMIEIVKPGWLTVKAMAIIEAISVAITIVAIALGPVYCKAAIWIAILYGTACAIWSVIEVPHSNKMLAQRYSYEENVSLKWLWVILLAFVVVFAMWIINVFYAKIETASIQLSVLILAWTSIVYFLWRHESVLEEFQPAEDAPAVTEADGDTESELARTIKRLFDEEKIYLNPRLKLSDVARLAASNRTYVSNFFNEVNGTSFYDYINGLRIEHACNLMRTTDLKLQEIALQSGFNSRATFNRVFFNLKGCAPSEWKPEA